ncbi:MAG: hypothetical protein GX116_06965 [Fibrobacter sp.]|jgi:hypothetical protein|nr:hypothetical protein [Fibrobacter sp.]
MKYFTKKTSFWLMILALCFNAFASSGLSLTGNLQSQAKKNLNTENPTLDDFWIRANLGASYKSEALDAVISIRMFGPTFGNTIDSKKYDKVMADLYWANYKWNLHGQKINFKLGHWKTDWSESANFGTYVDADLKKRGFWLRDYTHDAMEIGWTYAFSQLHVMLATTNTKYSTGYLRIEETLKLNFPLEIKAAYRVNALDVMEKSAVLTHRVASKVSYSILSDLKVYGELAFIKTGKNSEVTASSVANNFAIAPEYEQGSSFLPFYLGIDIPSAKFLDHFYLELEYIKNRKKLNKDNDDLAYTISAVKSFGNSKAQLSVFSGDKLKRKDVSLALRLTTGF